MKINIALTTRNVHRFLIFVILIGSVFVDLLNGYFNYYLTYTFPIGVLFRVAVTVYLFAFLLISQNGNILRFYIIATVLLWFLFQFVWLGNSEYTLGREVSQFIKILYPLLLAQYFLYAINRRIIDLNKLLKLASLNVLIAASFIIFSFITGIGLSTYGSADTTYGFGTTSFFKAQNDISLTMLIGFCFALYFLFTEKKFLNVFKCIIILFGLVLIGTRAGIVGGLLIVFVFVLQMLLFGNASTAYAVFKKIAYAIAVLIGLILCSYFVYLKIRDKPYMVNRYIEIITNPPREKLEEAADLYIDHRSKIAYIFGPGVGQYRSKLYGNLESKKESLDADEGKDAEKDVVDMIGAYGLLLGTWIVAFPIIACFMAFRNYVKRPFSYLTFAMFMGILIFVGHSVIAGHGIKNPAVGTVLSIVYVYTFSLPFATTKVRISNRPKVLHNYYS